MVVYVSQGHLSRKIHLVGTGCSQHCVYHPSWYYYAHFSDISQIRLSWIVCHVYLVASGTEVALLMTIGTSDWWNSHSIVSTDGIRSHPASHDPCPHWLPVEPSAALLSFFFYELGMNWGVRLLVGWFVKDLYISSLNFYLLNKLKFTFQSLIFFNILKYFFLYWSSLSLFSFVFLYLETWLKELSSLQDYVKCILIFSSNDFLFFFDFLR